ncbi:hypothetical protein L1987_41468 [Smallanthus sonchifolius]|uniref:Uncharacterized protein n=1 Tax=Smallanthus sonchifolius TaxID=185202 RepID=A0ACB9GVF6_9ASTR|nr:hypothetical protein L1987_41468 [Smallanthus sonchifolius]
MASTLKSTIFRSISSSLSLHTSTCQLNTKLCSILQVLEEARNHKRDSSSFRSAIDNKLQNPVSKDDNSKKIKKSRKRWWKNALHFFKRKHTSSSDNNYATSYNTLHCALSGPLYLAESRSGYSTPYHRSGPLAGTRKDDLNVPYISLRELNMDQTHKISASPMPIYLVT